MATVWTIVGRQVAQGIENCDIAGFFRATHGKIYYAVISKDTSEASTQGSALLSSKQWRGNLTVR